MSELFADASTTVKATLLILAVGLLISGAQLVASRGTFARSGLLSLHTMRLRRAIRWSPWRFVGDWDDSGWATAGVAMVKGAASVALVGAVASGRDPRLPLTMVAICTSLLALRGIAVSGADRLMHISALALLVGIAAGTDASVRAALLFVAAVSCLVYLTAGLAKATYPSWRSGEVLRRIASTRFWSNERSAALVQRIPSTVLAVVTRVGITIEVLFPLVLVMPIHVAVVGLAVGLCFHAATAAMMGLNLFVWAFLATYPAILFANRFIAKAFE